MRRAAGAGDDDLKACRLGALRESHQPVGGAMRGDDARVMIYAQRRQGFGGMAHGFPVGLASHDNGDRRGHSDILSQNQKDGLETSKTAPRWSGSGAATASSVDDDKAL